MGAGRPTNYTIELVDRICEQIAEGKSLAAICKADDMPAIRTVYKWKREHEEFMQQYTHAKEDQADYLAEQVLDIADDDTLEPADKRVRYDARRWLASKFKPKMYGDKVQQEVTGANGGPVESKWTVEFVNADADNLNKDAES